MSQHLLTDQNEVEITVDVGGFPSTSDITWSIQAFDMFDEFGNINTSPIQPCGVSLDGQNTSNIITLFATGINEELCSQKFTVQVEVENADGTCEVSKQLKVDVSGEWVSNNPIPDPCLWAPGYSESIQHVELGVEFPQPLEGPGSGGGGSGGGGGSTNNSVNFSPSVSTNDFDPIIVNSHYNSGGVGNNATNYTISYKNGILFDWVITSEDTKPKITIDSNWISINGELITDVQMLALVGTEIFTPETFRTNGILPTYVPCGSYNTDCLNSNGEDVLIDKEGEASITITPTSFAQINVNVTTVNPTVSIECSYTDNVKINVREPGNFFHASVINFEEWSPQSIYTLASRRLNGVGFIGFRDETTGIKNNYDIGNKLEHNRLLSTVVSPYASTWDANNSNVDLPPLMEFETTLEFELLSSFESNNTLSSYDKSTYLPLIQFREDNYVEGDWVGGRCCGTDSWDEVYGVRRYSGNEFYPTPLIYRPFVRDGKTCWDGLDPNGVCLDDCTEVFIGTDYSGDFPVSIPPPGICLDQPWPKLDDGSNAFKLTIGPYHHHHLNGNYTDGPVTGDRVVGTFSMGDGSLENYTSPNTDQDGNATDMQRLLENVRIKVGSPIKIFSITLNDDGTESGRTLVGQGTVSKLQDEVIEWCLPPNPPPPEPGDPDYDPNIPYGGGADWENNICDEGDMGINGEYTIFDIEMAEEEIVGFNYIITPLIWLHGTDWINSVGDNVDTQSTVWPEFSVAGNIEGYLTPNTNGIVKPWITEVVFPYNSKVGDKHEVKISRLHSMGANLDNLDTRIDVQFHSFKILASKDEATLSGTTIVGNDSKGKDLLSVNFYLPRVKVTSSSTFLNRSITI